MTNSPIGDPLVELRYALAGADAEDPPPRLLKLVATRAHETRRPGRPLREPEAIGPEVVFARAVNALDDLLGTLEDEAWHRHALRDLDVQGLVGHLIGVETDFQAALDGQAGAMRPADHVQATQEHAHAQRDRDPTSTHRDWQLLARRSVELLGHHAMSEEISLHGVTVPLEALLIVRSFELWTHTEDIERAVGRALSPPDPSSLQRMVDLAVQLLPRVLTSAAGDTTSTTVHLVLTGRAGGTFDVGFGSGPNTARAARVVADSIDFCRLVANRVPATNVALSVTGDLEAAEEFLTRAGALALD